MAVTVTAQFEDKLVVTRTDDLGLGANNTACAVTQKIDQGSSKFTSASAVPVTKSFSKVIALSGGAATIDLTAVDVGTLPDEDWSGLKIQFIAVKATDANASRITVKTGAVNGYEIWGSTGGEIAFAAGQRTAMNLNEKQDDVGPTDKTIDLTGSGTETIEIQLVAG